MSPLNAAICTTTYLERQKCYGPDKKILFKKPLFDLEVKSQGHRKVIMHKTHRLMVMLPHTKYHWPISKETIIWPWGQRSRSNKGHYCMWHTALWSCTYTPNIIDLSRKTKMLWLGQQNTIKKHYLTLRSKVKIPRRSLRYTTHRLMVMHPHTKYHWPISKDKKCYGQDKKILFKKQLFDLHVKGQGPTKVITVCDTPPYGHAPTYQISLTYLERNNYLTLRSKDTVPRRSLRYVTHRLMVIHPHTKYHWPISRQKCYGPDKKILFKKQLFDLEVKVQTKVIMVRDTPLMDMHPHTKYHWPISKDKKCYGPNKKILFKKQLFDLQVKGHYGMQHTTLWTCTHIPNIIDLSRKTNKLWSGQASLRSRSGRKKSAWNNIYLPSFEGET